VGITVIIVAEHLVTTANVTPKTTNSNSLLPSTASNDIQQHVNSANSGDVDIRNLTVTCLLQSAFNPTCLLQVNDFPTHLYFGSGSLIFGEISAHGTRCQGVQFNTK
jgi:hypothetical protein